MVAKDVLNAVFAGHGEGFEQFVLREFREGCGDVLERNIVGGEHSIEAVFALPGFEQRVRLLVEAKRYGKDRGAWIFVGENSASPKIFLRVARAKNGPCYVPPEKRDKLDSLPYSEPLKSMCRQACVLAVEVPLFVDFVLVARGLELSDNLVSKPPGKLFEKMLSRYDQEQKRRRGGPPDYVIEKGCYQLASVIKDDLEKAFEIVCWDSGWKTCVPVLVTSAKLFSVKLSEADVNASGEVLGGDWKEVPWLVYEYPVTDEKLYFEERNGLGGSLYQSVPQRDFSRERKLHVFVVNGQHVKDFLKKLRVFLEENYSRLWP